MLDRSRVFFEPEQVAITAQRRPLLHWQDDQHSSVYVTVAYSHKTEKKCATNRNSLRERSLKVGYEIYRHEQNHQIQNNGERFVGSEELRVLYATRFDRCVPKALNGCAAENADQKLKVWSVIDAFEKNPAYLPYCSNHPTYVKSRDYLQRTSRA